MAHIEGKGSKSASVELNIVPFIDLMSVLIIFLLITAVWQQVSMIQVGSSIYGKKTSDEKVVIPEEAKTPLRLDVLDSGHRVVFGKQKFSIPKNGAEYDLPKLVDTLKKIKDRIPKKTDAIITIGDSMKYLYLINGMDSLLEAGFPEIVIATGGAR